MSITNQYSAAFHYYWSRASSVTSQVDAQSQHHLPPIPIPIPILMVPLPLPSPSDGGGATQPMSSFKKKKKISPVIRVTSSAPMRMRVEGLEAAPHQVSVNNSRGGQDLCGNNNIIIEEEVVSGGCFAALSNIGSICGNLISRNHEEEEAASSKPNKTAAVQLINDLMMGVGQHAHHSKPNYHHALTVAVSSAVKLDGMQIALIARKMQRLTGFRNLRLDNIIDPSLIAGFVITYDADGSNTIDLSVKGQLNALAARVESSDQVGREWASD